MITIRQKLGAGHGHVEHAIGSCILYNNGGADETRTRDLLRDSCRRPLISQVVTGDESKLPVTNFSHLGSCGVHVG